MRALAVLPDVVDDVVPLDVPLEGVVKFCTLFGLMTITERPEGFSDCPKGRRGGGGGGG